jgi:hypothetical protein
VPSAAARRLNGLVVGGFDLDATTRGILLAEWLRVAADGGWRIPPAMLPDLLDYGRHHADQRGPIAAVGGVRLQWLAGQNPDWHYLTAVESTSDDPEVWATGTAGQRVGFLRSLRNRAPDEARQLLTTEWAALTPDERADLIVVLADGLDPADEPLLEPALDDRRQAVRDTAAALLSRLAGSAYAARMTARAQAALAVVDAAVTAVAPPAECDKSMRRDGIAAKPPAGYGVRAWWLEEIVAHTPLSVWPSGLQVAESAQEWAGPVYSGLARAAAQQRQPQWAAAMLDQLTDSVRDRSLATALYQVLDPAEVVRRAGAALRQERTAVWGGLLANCPPPWPEELGHEVLAGIRALAAKTELLGELGRLCRLAAVRLPTAFAASMEDGESTVDALDDLARILRFRYEMIMEMG